MRQELKGFTVEDNRQNAAESNDTTQLDLNSNTWESCSNEQVVERNNKSKEENHKGLLTFSHDQGKPKTNRTGFKPYKRCPVEARESRVLNSSSPEQEKCSKRLRLEGEAASIWCQMMQAFSVKGKLGHNHHSPVISFFISFSLISVLKSSRDFSCLYYKRLHCSFSFLRLQTLAFFMNSRKNHHAQTLKS